MGDAYGAGFEFASREKIDQLNTLERYEKHPRFESIYKRYTDDTQMALAIAEYILEGEDWTALGIANKFVEVFRRDPRQGYGGKFYQVLNESANGAELLEKVASDSKRNGAVMRVYPIGIFPDVKVVLERAKLQASLTHNTTEAITSAQAIALMTYFCYYRKGPLNQLPGFLSEVQGIHWNTSWSGEVQIDAIQSTEAVLTILTSSPCSLKKMLIDSISLGGDVDTVGSLVMAIASLDDAVEKDLPEWLYHELDEDQYGLKYIQDVDTRLQALYPRNIQPQ